MENSEKYSTSKSINETVNESHQFTVKGYSLAKGMGPGKCLSSDVFTVGGYNWAIYFYPDGKNPEDGALYVSLFELTLADQSGKGKHKVHSHFDRALESGPYTLKYRGSMCSRAMMSTLWMIFRNFAMSGPRIAKLIVAYNNQVGKVKGKAKVRE